MAKPVIHGPDHERGHADPVRHDWEDTGTGAIGLIVVSIQVTDPAASALTVGEGKFYFRVPSIANGAKLVAIAAHVVTVSSSGAVSVGLYNNTAGAEMLTTNVTVDAGEHDSITAATPPVINAATAGVSTADELRVDVDGAGTGAKGLMVELQFG